jgi:hypothetical protein
MCTATTDRSRAVTRAGDSISPTKGTLPAAAATAFNKAKAASELGRFVDHAPARPSQTMVAKPGRTLMTDGPKSVLLGT